MPCGANSARVKLLHRGIPTITGLSARNTIEARDTVATILDLQFLFSSYREAILSDASAACAQVRVSPLIDPQPECVARPGLTDFLFVVATPHRCLLRVRDTPRLCASRLPRAVIW